MCICVPAREGKERGETQDTAMHESNGGFTYFLAVRVRVPGNYGFRRRGGRSVGCFSIGVVCRRVVPSEWSLSPILRILFFFFFRRSR